MVFVSLVQELSTLALAAPGVVSKENPAVAANEVPEFRVGCVRVPSWSGQTVYSTQQ